MNHQNLANLTTQYQQTYLIYCYKIMQYLSLLAWMEQQQRPSEPKVKPKSASGVKKLAQEVNQQKSTLKSLKHLEKADVSTIVAMGFPNGAMSAAFRVAFNDALFKNGFENSNKPAIVAGIYGAGKNGGDNPFLEALVTDQGGVMFKANQESDIVNYLTAGAKDGRDVVIYGYSRGGNAAINVANKLGKNGITVSNLTTFDPHSLSDNKTFQLKYNNVIKANNYFQRNPRTCWRLMPCGTNPYWGSPVRSKFIHVNEVNFTGQNFAPNVPVSHLNIVTYSNRNN